MSSKLIKSNFRLSDLLTNTQEVIEYLRTLELQAAIEGSQSLGYCQRAVLQAFRAQRLVETGHMRDFYEEFGEPLEAVAAFAELGLNEAASAMELSMEAFPPGLLRADRQTIVAWMDENVQALEEQWYPLGLVIMDLTAVDPCEEDNDTILLSAVRNYFTVNAEAFGFER